MKLVRTIQSVIGLDIGTTSVKVIVLREGVSGISLVDYRLAELPLSLDKKENVPMEMVLEALREVMAGLNVKHCKVISVVAGQRVSVRKVIVPHMPKEDLLEAVKWEAKEHIPFPIENAIVDFHIIGEVTDKAVKKLELMVVAVERFVIDQHIALLQNVQILPTSITVAPFALTNVLKKNDYFKSGESIAVVSSGAETTTINVFHGENLLFNREIPLGGNTITRSMVGTLISDSGQVDLDVNQADILKKDWGIPDERNPQQLTPEINSMQIVPLLRPNLERLANEIRRSFDYYREDTRGKKVSRVILLGGNAELKGLKEFLQNALGLEVEVTRSFKNIQIELSAEKRQELELLSPRLGIALGAALTGGKGVNLLPREIREQATKTARNAMTALISFLIAFIFAMVYAHVYMQLRSYQKLAVTNQSALASLKQQVAQAYELQVLQEKMAARKNLIQLITADEPLWVEMLRTISQCVPERIILEEIQTKKVENPAAAALAMAGNTGESAGNANPEQPEQELPVVFIRGMILLGGERPEAVLAHFMQSLERSRYFQETDLSFLQKGQETEGQTKESLTFEIVGKPRTNAGQTGSALEM